MNKIFLAVALALVLALPVFAESPSPTQAPLTAEQETALRDFAASLAVEPPQVQLVAELHAPKTTFQVRFPVGEYENFNTVMRRYTGSEGDALQMGSYQEPFVREWKPTLSCGTWSLGFPGGIWSHATEAPDNCPHDQGTSHPGTIAVKGDYRIDFYSVTPNGPRGELVLAGIWSFTCIYQGSESGASPCEEQLKNWEGRYGSTVTGPGQQPFSPKKTAAVAAAIAAAAAAGYIFRARIRRLIRSR